MKRLILLLALSVSVFGCSCPTSFAQDPGKLNLHSKSMKASRYPVFFVTDRQIKSTPKGMEFSNNRSTELDYGCYQLSTATAEKVNPSDITLYGSKDTFYDNLHKTGATKVAVFVHGYRKDFEGSLEFAQRIAAELEMPVVLFAWPSKNKYSAYMIDECTAEWSSHQFASMLKDMNDRIGNQNISLISHSLGARIVSWSLRILAADHALDRPFGCSLFFSPDIDRDTFLAESGFLKQSCERVKVYLDAHDTRIWLSKMLHGSPRLGTMDGNSENETLSSMFQFDTSMPSHHIPFPTLSAALDNPVEPAIPTVRN